MPCPTPLSWTLFFVGEVGPSTNGNLPGPEKLWDLGPALAECGVGRKQPVLAPTQILLLPPGVELAALPPSVLSQQHGTEGAAEDLLVPLVDRPHDPWAPGHFPPPLTPLFWA